MVNPTSLQHHHKEEFAILKLGGTALVPSSWSGDLDGATFWLQPAWTKPGCLLQAIFPPSSVGFRGRHQLQGLTACFECVWLAVEEFILCVFCCSGGIVCWVDVLPVWPWPHVGVLALQVLAELKEYATEVDVDFVRKAVRAIGRCAIKVEASTWNSGFSMLLRLQKQC